MSYLIIQWNRSRNGILTSTTGGGFSNIYPAPKWQQSAIDKYFEEEPSPYEFYKTKYSNDVGGSNNGLFNRAGRGIPDVAASGDNIVMVNRNETIIDWGTSASAPIFASIINRINGERLKQGKSTVGFILPALYSNPQVFTDITKGNNPGCDTPGFKAAKGWDPVTGLGTPKYSEMLELFMGYQ
jgi:tripeptidyl-peptidase I